MKTLRDYQVEARDAVTTATKPRALIVLASGLGKMVIAAHIARQWREADGMRILFIVHMHEAVQQALKQFGEEFEGRSETMGLLNGRIRKHAKADMTFATFQTMRNHLKRFRRDAFGLIIVDEAHHGQAATYRDVIEYFKPDFMLGMTATPERTDGRDIRELFGHEVYSYPLEQALAEGRWLAEVEYHVLVDNVDTAALKKLLKRARNGERFSKRDIDSTIFLKERLEEVVRLVREYQRGGKKTIIFCRSINHIHAVQKYFPEGVPYYSRLPETTVKERYTDFEAGRIQTLLVVNKFNEAVDIPDTEMLVFLRATESETIWRQQLGRGLRRSNGKRKVVVLDFVADCRRFRMIKQFGIQPKEKQPREEPLTIETGWRVHFSETVVNILELLEQLGKDPWKRRFAELLAYRTIYGDCNVPRDWPNNPKLALWVETQRKLYKKGTLSEERIRRLNEIGFEWSPHDAQWSRFLTELIVYKARYGDCNVPQRWPENQRLANWISEQRLVYKKGTLSEERIRRLNEIGFEWSNKRGPRKRR